MKWFIVALAVCSSAPLVFGAKGGLDWCYHLPECNYKKWPEICPQYCKGSRQSPINIVSSKATGDPHLGPFTFHGFDSTSALTKIENTGKTVKVTLASGVGIEGGGLSEPYDSLHFTLHWGSCSSVPGSEHAVDGKHYPMELQILNLKSCYHGNTAAGIADSTGLAALAFFIDVIPGDSSSQPPAWNTLTSLLYDIAFEGESLPVTPGITLTQLLAGVDCTKYYRYLGSLTTPTCNEVVVWTVFKEPVRISADLIDLFSTVLYIGKTTSSPLMTNIYRGIQPEQPVTTQGSPKHGSHCWQYRGTPWVRCQHFNYCCSYYCYYLDNGVGLTLMYCS